MTETSEKAKQVLLQYQKLYRERYGEYWMPTMTHVGEAVSLFKSPIDGVEAYTVDDILRRCEEYFRRNDEWIVSCKHNFSVFVKHIHRWNPPLSPHRHTRTSAGLNNRRSYRCDCGAEVAEGQLCEHCFPVCPRCSQRHYKDETCDAYKERIQDLKHLFQGAQQ